MHRSADVCFHEPGGEDRSHEIWREEAGLVVTPDARQAAVIDLNSGPAGHLVNLTVVVPTRNEAESVATLLERLGPAVEPLGAEIIFVDDSDDDTPGALADCARTYSVPTRLLHRVPGDRNGGASRMLVSSWATRLVKSWFPRRLAMVSDPLSGLFAFRASAIDLHRLNPVGFKILLEMLVRQPAARVAEVALPFRPAPGRTVEGVGP
jgi:hypothetical protein